MADHVTPSLLTSLVSLAVKLTACPKVRLPRAGVRLTVMLLGAIVMVAVEERVGSLIEVAPMVTVGVPGMVAGAV